MLNSSLINQPFYRRANYATFDIPSTTKPKTPGTRKAFFSVKTYKREKARASLPAESVEPTDVQESRATAAEGKENLNC
jgi:hypothetical protein